MSRGSFIIGLTTLLMSGGCGSRVDVAHEADGLLATDRAWAKSAAAGNFDSIVANWTDDARVAMSGAPLVRGKAAIREMVKSSMAIPGFRILWTPDSAVVSASGDLGYTFGSNSVTAPDAGGKLSTVVGRYITVWHKDADGRWRCVMDYTSPGPAPAAGT